MKTKMVTIENKAAGEITLSSSVFSIEVRKDILRRVVRWQLAKRQAGTHKTKTISEIRGTTAKPFNQKGTGRARQGSNYSAQMRGGATMFGPVVRSHSHSLPKKIRALGLRSALSEKKASNNLVIVKDIKCAEIKTSKLSKSLEGLGNKRMLIIDGDVFDEKFAKSAANLKNIQLLPAIGANVYDILRNDTLVLTESAVKKLEERLA